MVLRLLPVLIPANAPMAPLRASRRRAAFEAAWSIFLANRTEADFETYQSRRGDSGGLGRRPFLDLPQKGLFESL
jgi:hypothetical protein